MNRLMETTTALWLERNGKERAVLTLVAALLMLGLFYVSLIGPALAGRTQLEKSLPILRQQSAELQVLAKQAVELAGSGATPAPGLSKESIETALGRRGLKAQSVALSGDLVKVQLAAVSFVSMLDWLDEMQKTARLSVVDANIVALPAADSVNAALTLKQQRAEE
jgi:general secretion pathway protein M